MSNYPPGAKYDTRAPYNEMSKTVSVCVSITYHKDIEIEVEGAYDDSTLKYLTKEAISDITKYMESDGWVEDEFEAIED